MILWRGAQIRGKMMDGWVHRCSLIGIVVAGRTERSEREKDVDFSRGEK